MATSRAKKPSKAAEDEHMALEDAMQELARQTDALLSPSTPKKEEPKPTLPAPATSVKKKRIPHTKGAHLDIVGHAPSTVKRAKPVSKPAEEHELLEAHAGKSYNEVSAKGNNEVSAAGHNEVSAAGHNEVSAGSNNEVSAKGNNEVAGVKDDAAEPEPPVITLETTSHESKTPAIITSHGAPITPASAEATDVKASHIAVVDNSKEQSVKTHSDSHSKADEHKPAESKPPAKEMAAAPASSTSTIAFSEKSPGSEDDTSAPSTHHEDKSAEHATSEKPSTFDTSEYHPELHDWSKLSSSNHWSIFILLLLVVLAGGLAYLYFTGMLPQM